VESSILYIACMFLGGAGAWLVVRWGSGLGLLDKANHRSSHKGVVPKGGGIGILAAFLLASGVLGLPILFWMCAGLISLLSLYGDRREIPPKVRLSIQLLGSVGLLFGLFYWEGRGWSVYLLIPFYAVFMGDVGSVLLGFVFAGLVVGLSCSLNDFMVLCAFLFPFYADELITLYVRIKENGGAGMLMKPHRRHFYQLLVNEMGIEHWKVSVGYGALQLVVGMGALALRGMGIWQ